MKYWQKKRNYRKYENADGTFTYTITADGRTVEVSEDVYLAYSQADRRERYRQEQEEGLLLSLEKMTEDEMRLDRVSESAEDAAVRNMLASQAGSAVELLDEDEEELITLLFYEQAPLRETARRMGVYPQAIAYRRDRILKKMKKLLGF